jgi:hypothetical protein
MIEFVDRARAGRPRLDRIRLLALECEDPDAVGGVVVEPDARPVADLACRRVEAFAGRCLVGLQAAPVELPPGIVDVVGPEDQLL